MGVLKKEKRQYNFVQPIWENPWKDWKGRKLPKTQGMQSGIVTSHRERAGSRFL